MMRYLPPSLQTVKGVCYACVSPNSSSGPGSAHNLLHRKGIVFCHAWSACVLGGSSGEDIAASIDHKRIFFADGSSCVTFFYVSILSIIE